MNSPQANPSRTQSRGIHQLGEAPFTARVLAFCRAHRLLVLFLGAFAIRVVFILAAGPTAVPSPWGDDHLYDQIAYSLVSQHQYTNTLYPPGYPLFLALNYAVFGRSWFLARLVQAAIGAATCLLVYRLGSKVFSERVGLVAGVLLAIYPGHVFFCWRLMGEPLYMLLVVWSLVAGLSLAEDPQPLRGFALGVLVGVAQLVKTNIFLFPAMLLVWFAFSARANARRRALCVGAWIAGLAVTVLLQSVANYLSPTHEFHLLPNNGGVTLWVSNNPNSVGFTDMNPNSPEILAFVERHGFADRWRVADEAEIEKIDKSLAMSWIRENPGQFLALMPKKLLNAFGPFPRAHVFEGSSLPRRIIHSLTYGFVALFALGGMFATRRHWGACSVVYVVLVSYVPTVLLFYGTPRWTLMIIPELIIFASYALVASIDYLAGSRRRSPSDPASAQPA